jgi:hypothetical protein
LPTRPALAATANDDLSNATVIGAIPFSDTVDTTTATTAFDDPSCFGNAASVWYQFTPDTDTLIGVRAIGQGYWATLSAYTGSPGDLTQIGCSLGDPDRSVPSRLTIAAAAATTYYFMAAGFTDSPGGTLTLMAFGIPPNDDILNATQIPSLPFSDTVEMRLATSDADDPSCGPSPSVWYRFTPTTDMGVSLVAHIAQDIPLGTRNPPHVSVYTGAPGNLTQVTCGEEPGPVLFAASAGTTYYIKMTADGDRYTLTATEGPLPPHVALAVNDTGSVNAKTGIATVSGNISCTPVSNDSFVTTLAVNGILTQRLGRQTFQANFSWVGTCTAGPVLWSATAQSSQGLFVGGKAMVSASASAHNSAGDDYASVGPFSISLKGR